MSKTTLESLPNEILLIIFGYLSSSDLCQAFLDIENYRIQRLLSSMNHVLDVSSMSYVQLGEFLNEENNHINRFLTLVHTVILENSWGSVQLFHNWKTRLSKWLLSIRKLIVFDGHLYEYGMVDLIKSLTSVNDTLKYIHIVFKTPNCSYSSVLSRLVSQHISIHTMTLAVKQGHSHYSTGPVKTFYDMEPLCWPNTVQLTLSIQDASELALLLKHGALPAVEHLSVTNEEIYTVQMKRQKTPILKTQLCENSLRQTADGCRLRSLILRFISLKDTITLLNSLTMPVLEKLILIDLYDDTLQRVGKFQEYFAHTNLPALKDLYFTFCFPQEMEDAWRTSPFNSNRNWPFDNLGSYLDDHCFYINDVINSQTHVLFIVYKHPINIYLQYKRTVHNHRLAGHVRVPVATGRRQSFQMTCDQLDQPLRLINTLQVIASSSVNELHLVCKAELTCIPMTENYLVNHNLLYSHLRSLTFAFKGKSLQSADRSTIVQQILDASPNLSRLVINWKDFQYCSKTYSNLKHLEIVLDRRFPEPKQYFDVNRLAQLFPCVNCLETSGANIMPDENLVAAVLQILCRFRQLVSLIINKDSLYDSGMKKKTLFKESLIKAGNNRLFDYSSIRIKFYSRDALHIWL